MDVETRFLVLGSGIAGLSFALRVAEHGPVAVVTKKGTAESATNYAQGGIAAVIDSADSLESHVEDTLRAGAGLCDEAVVRFVIEHGPEAVRSLIDLGVRFDPSDREPGYVGAHTPPAGPASPCTGQDGLGGGPAACPARS